MGILDLFTNPQKAVTDVAQDVTNKVTSEGGSFLMDLLSSPFRAISGLASGVFGSLWNGVKYTGILLGVQFLAPAVFNPVYGAIFGKEALEKLQAGREKDGLPGVILDSAKLGFGTAAALGGASGAIGNTADSFGGKLGAVATFAGVAAVTIGALHKGDIKLADSNAPAAPLPAPTGAKPKTEQAK